MKTNLVWVPVILIVVVMFTMQVSAAGIVDGIKNADTQAREAISIICGLSGVIGAVWIFATTKSKTKSIGALLFGAVLAFLVSSPELLKGWGSDIGGWF